MQRCFGQSHSHHTTTSQRDHLLGVSDDMEYGHESLHDAKLVMDDIGQGAKQLAQGALLSILSCHISYIVPITNMGHPQKGQR